MSKAKVANLPCAVRAGHGIADSVEAVLLARHGRVEHSREVIHENYVNI
jgi:hypothetical protein